MKAPSSIFRTIAALLLLCVLQIASAATPEAPDFAFPLKVEKTAKTDIDKALKQRDAAALTNAAVRYALAKHAVSTDSAGAVLSMISELAERSDASVAAPLLRLLEADILSACRNRSNLSDQAAPAGVYNYGNLAEWGKTQFDDAIVDLCRRALADREQLRAVKLSDFEGTLEYQSSAPVYYPTLYDFAVYKVVALVSRLLPYSDNLSRELALAPSDLRLYPAGQPQVRFILDAYTSLIGADTGNAPLILALANRESFILDRVFDPDSGSGNLRDEAFLKLFNQHISNPFAGLLLADLSVPDALAGRREMHRIASGWLADNSASPAADIVKGYIELLERPEATINVQPQVAKGVPFNVAVALCNIRETELALYDLSGMSANARDRAYRLKDLASLKPLAVRQLSVAGELPSEGVDTVSFTIDKYGLYALVLKGERDNQIVKVLCSDIAATAVGTASDALLQAVDPRTGRPLSDVKFRYSSSRNNTNVFTTSQATAADGLLKTSFPSSGEVTPVRGDDRWGDALYVRDYRGDGDDSRAMASLFTSLALYRPGDDLEFSLLAFENGPEGNRLLADRKFEVLLLGVNWDVIDRQTVTTDNLGRVSGAFALPTEGLQGDYHLRASLPGGRTLTTKSVTVSDYKLPTFEVEILSTQRPASAGSPAIIKGRATAYSGFPIGNASVDLQLTVSTSRWWWGMTSPVFYQASAVTSETGEFELTIPGDVIASSPYPTGYFNAEISVTAENGETCPASAGFSMGKPCAISFAIPSVLTPDLLSSAAVNLQTADTAVNPAEVTLIYKVFAISTSPYSDEETGRRLVADGKTAPGALGSVLGRLPAGLYRMEAATEDASLADSAESSTFIIYDPAADLCPVTALLWLPSLQVIADADGTARVPLFTSENDVTAIVSLWSDDQKLLQCSTLALSKGRNMLEFPVGSRASTLRIGAVKDFNRASYAVGLLPAAAHQQIDVEISSFRDKVLPTSQEQITLKVVPRGGASASAAVWLNMSSRAINSLQPNSLAFAAPGFSAPYVSAYSGQLGMMSRSAWSAPYKSFGSLPDAPSFNLYGLSFNGRRLMIRGARQMRSKATAANGGEKMEDMLEESVVEYAAPMMMNAKMASFDTAAGAATDDAAVEADGGEEKGSTQQEISYRPSEIPLAFFCTDLKTDADGTLTYTYRVPDANTSWLLQAMAVNGNLLSARASATITASKPLMVNINRPRFLRCGDSLELAASVMNNSSDSVKAGARMELLDAMTLQPLASAVDSLMLAPMGASVQRLSFNVPDTIAGVILRASASAAGFSDGEQVYIPILPSSQNVVESEQFFIPSDSRSYEMNLPRIAAGDRAVLRFNENPVWEVVTALPALAEGEMESSLTASAALFSAATAEGLVRRYPSLRAALRIWQANPQDSALVSNLEKDSGLKQTLLSATPWIADGLDETRRRERLLLLLGKNNSSEAIGNAVDRLAKLRVSGGGWSWTSAYPSYSPWVTGRILLQLGQLNILGFLPNDSKLADMTEEALKRIDSDAARDYAKYPKADYTVYCYIASLFPDHKPSTAARKVINAGIQRILRSWREDAPARKAADALILHRNGYNATARQIIASLRELSTSTPERGMWWAQLDRPASLWNNLDKIGATSLILTAFATVEPGAADIEKIRQWLILNKTNNAWGDAASTSLAVAAILGSGNPPELASRTTAIHIGDRLIEPGETERVTGSFNVDITSLLTSPGQLRIDRQVDYPSFGSVMLFRTLPMAEIKSAKCSSLAVEKQLTVYRDGQWQPSENFATGDRVKVVLTLKVTDDMEYVVVNDPRAAALEPASQLPEPVYAAGALFYRENRDAATILYIDRLNKGVYRLEYELFATRSGSFSSGSAQAQSLYNPSVAAHSAAGKIEINP